jgi:hypothetical protein
MTVYEVNLVEGTMFWGQHHYESPEYLEKKLALTLPHQESDLLDKKD